MLPPTPRGDIAELHARLQKRLADMKAKRAAVPDKPPRKRRRKEDRGVGGAPPASDDDTPNTATATATTPQYTATPSSSTHPTATHTNTSTHQKQPQPKPTFDFDASFVPLSTTTTATTTTKTSKREAEVPVPEHITYGRMEFGTRQLPDYSAEPRKKLSKVAQLRKLEREQAKKAAAVASADGGEGDGEVSGGVVAADDKKWDKMMAKAKGEKVKDNAALLRKSIKKDAYKKKRSQKEWAEREQETKRKQEQKIKRRNENMAEYLEKKKQKRIAKRTGLKLKRPGFEGKKKKFINKK
eukprot:TRINITY_DN1098_c0_g1_i2.p1 TRINITY_DN1098_c0_g1~~TRINITY_DN1098_c0_g1_i2.p1  ORF type:complete len:298 (+),score=107.21 TRINITY_DN1098_c0_g1_i2:785-1678(+)